MSRLRFSLSLLAVALLAASGPAAAETLEALEAKLAGQWDEVDSFKVDVTIEATMSLGFVSVTTKQSGPMEFKRFEDAGRFRMELSGTMGASLPGMGEGIAQRMLSVYDGEYMYNEVEMMGQKRVGKKKPDASDTAKAKGGGSLLESMQKMGEVALLPDEAVNGHEVHVVEVRYNEEAIEKTRGQATHHRIYVDKETGMQVKMQVLNDDTTVMTMTYGEYDVNVDIPDDRFTYTPAPGVQVVDMDQPGAGGLF